MSQIQKNRRGSGREVIDGAVFTCPCDGSCLLFIHVICLPFLPLLGDFESIQAKADLVTYPSTNPEPDQNDFYVLTSGSISEAIPYHVTHSHLPRVQGRSRRLTFLFARREEKLCLRCSSPRNTVLHRTVPLQANPWVLYPALTRVLPVRSLWAVLALR
jgi:hypothetical protein